MRFFVVLSVAVVAGCAADRGARSGEAGPSSIAETLEVTPGLRTQDVSKALAPVRAQLKDCSRLVVRTRGHDLLDLPDGKDDRVSIPFTIQHGGSVKADYDQARSVYLEEACVTELLESLKFEPLLVPDVSVTWTLSFSTTAAERAARRTELASSYARLCEALTEGLPPGGGPPSEDYAKKSKERALALAPSLAPIAGHVARSLATVSDGLTRWHIFRGSSEEFGFRASCPALEWFDRQ